MQASKRVRGTASTLASASASAPAGGSAPVETAAAIVYDISGGGKARAGAATAPEVTPDGLLASFVYPMGVSEFKDRVYRRKCLAVHGGGTARLQAMCDEYFCEGKLAKLLEVTASEHIFCWFKQRDGSISSIEVDSPAAALTSHGAGASLYFRSSQQAADALVGAMSRDLGMSFAGVHQNGECVVPARLSSLLVVVTSAWTCGGIACVQVTSAVKSRCLCRVRAI